MGGRGIGERESKMNDRAAKWKHGTGKGKSTLVRKGNKQRRANYGAKPKNVGKGGKRWKNRQTRGNWKIKVGGGKNKKGGAQQKRWRRGGRRRRMTSQPGSHYPKKTAEHHIGDPPLGELADLQKFRRKILAELDEVKADVNNIVAIAQSKKKVAAT